MNTSTNHIVKKATLLLITTILLISTTAVMANTNNQPTSHQKTLPDISLEHHTSTETTITSSGREIIFQDGFETYTDFILDFPPWTQYDGDGRPTYYISGYTFPNQGYTGSYIIFNPSQVTPPLTGHPPHSGEKYAACFDAVPPPTNDDWLITPPLISEAYYDLSFWARSLTDQYGLERIQVGVSTTNTSPSSFEIISTPPYLEVPTSWTEYRYNLSGYNGEDIYIGIHCISEDAFALFLDDVEVTGTHIPPDFLMVVENTTVHPGETGHVVHINGSYIEEIFGYYIQLIWAVHEPGVINFTGVTLEGCVSEGAEYLQWVKTDYGTSGSLEIIVIYTIPFYAGNGIPAGEGTLVNLFVDVNETATPQRVYLNESGIPSYYYNVSGSVDTEFYNGHIQIIPFNSPPPAPNQPSGPTAGFTGEEYTYTTDEVVDPDGDDVEYLFDWGDGNDSGWVAEPTADYTWMSTGTFAVKVKARDIPHGEESDWSPSLDVTISDAMPELEITGITGGIGVSATISNSGDADATMVDWSISFDGGLILPSERNGSISVLVPGGEETVNALVLGLGKPMITVAAECAEAAAVEAQVRGIVFLILVFGVS